MVALAFCDHSLAVRLFHHRYPREYLFAFYRPSLHIYRRYSLFFVRLFVHHLLERTVRLSLVYFLYLVISNEIETGLFFSRTRSRDTLLVFLVLYRLCSILLHRLCPRFVREEEETSTAVVV